MSTPLTIEQLEEWLDEIFEDRRIKEKEKTIIITQGCKTYGWVERTDMNLNLCDDRECTSCSELIKILANENR